MIIISLVIYRPKHQQQHFEKTLLNNKFSDLSLGIKPHLDLELESIGGD